MRPAADTPRARACRILLQFGDILKVAPHDKPCKLFMARCLEFKQEDPGEGWDGVYR